MGGFSVTGSEGTVELPADAQRVVAFLALGRQRVPRSYVAGTLWIEGTQERAFGNLRSALWRLRRAAGSLVEADTQTLGLAGEAAIDVDSIIAAGATAWPAEAAIPHQPDLFSQELLPGWCDEWVVFERERLRQLSLHALESISLELTRRGRFSAAIDCALAAIRLDALRESAHRCLIRIHLAEGNYSEAIRHYREYELLLLTELGIRSSPQIHKLLESSDLA